MISEPNDPEKPTKGLNLLAAFLLGAISVILALVLIAIFDPDLFSTILKALAMEVLI